MLPSRLQRFCDAATQIVLPIGKSRRNGAQVATFNDGKCMLHEKLSSMGKDWQFEPGAQWDTLANLADQGVDRRGFGATLLHRTVVKSRSSSFSIRVKILFVFLACFHRFERKSQNLGSFLLPLDVRSQG